MSADFVFGGQTAGDSPNDDFFRLLGDIEGNGAVNAVDLGLIVPALFTAPGDAGYRHDLNTNGDAAINNIDLVALVPTLFTSFRQ